MNAFVQVYLEGKSIGFWSNILIMPFSKVELLLLWGLWMKNTTIPQYHTVFPHPRLNHNVRIYSHHNHQSRAFNCHTRIYRACPCHACHARASTQPVMAATLEFPAIRYTTPVFSGIMHVTSEAAGPFCVFGLHTALQSMSLLQSLLKP